MLFSIFNQKLEKKVSYMKDSSDFLSKLDAIKFPYKIFIWCLMMLNPCTQVSQMKRKKKTVKESF